MKDYDTGEEMDDFETAREEIERLADWFFKNAMSHPMCRCIIRPSNPNRMFLKMVRDVGIN